MCLLLGYAFFITTTVELLLYSWMKAGISVIIGTVPASILLYYFYTSTDRVRIATEQTNRYNWPILNINKPDGPRYKNVYLDSPATQPSIFGPDGDVFCIPVLEANDHLACLLVQSLENSDYGPRYQRISLAKIRMFHGGSKDVLHITTSPGHNQIKDGQYYGIPKLDRAGNMSVENNAEERVNESLICII